MTLLLAAALIQQDNEAIQRKIAAMRIDANFADTPLKDVAEFFRDVADINIILDREVLEKGITVTLRAKDIRLKTALNLILQANQLGMLVEEGILKITAKEKSLPVTLHIFDIQDIVNPVKHFPGGEITFGDSGLDFIQPEPETSFDMGDSIVEIVKTFTGGKIWDETPNASITYQRGLLIVKQTKETLRKIQDILLQLRALQ